MEIWCDVMVSKKVFYILVFLENGAYWTCQYMVILPSGW